MKYRLRQKILAEFHQAVLRAERQKILAEFHQTKDRDEARELFHKLKRKIRKHDGLIGEIAQHVYGRLPEGKQIEMF